MTFLLGVIAGLALGGLVVWALLIRLRDEEKKHESKRDYLSKQVETREAQVRTARRTQQIWEATINHCHAMLDGLVLGGELNDRVRLIVQRLQHAEGLLEGNPVDGGEFLLALGHVHYHAAVLVEKINDEGEVKDGHQEVEALVAALQEYAAVFATVEGRKRKDAENPAHAEEIAARDATIERLHGTLQKANGRERTLLRKLRPEVLARKFHETYEELAPTHDYETREASAVPWDDVPTKNKELMIATCQAIVRDLRAGELVEVGQASMGEAVADAEKVTP